MKRLVGRTGQTAGELETPRYKLWFDGVVYDAPGLEEDSHDTELVLSLIERFGVRGALDKLNADFALALHDTFEDVLYLARDRFGIKPLYYMSHNNIRAFASQPSLLTSVTNIPLDADPAFVARFAGNHYRGIDQDPAASPYRNVAQVPPATVVALSRNGVRQQRYWSLTEKPEWQQSEEELAEQYRELIVDAVRVRQRTAGNSAFTLSGGLDSSTALASYVELTGQAQPAFSAVYDDATFDESADIQPMLAKHVSHWHQVLVKNPDVFTLIARMVALHDEPVVTATWLSHYLLTEAVTEAGYTTLWGGLGGDELNAGEYEYFMYYFADLRRQGAEDALEEEIAAWVRYHNHPVWQKSAALVERELSRLVDLTHPGVCRVDYDRLWHYHHALSPEWAAEARGYIPAEHPFSSYLKNRTYQDLTRETLPCCLRAEDRHTAAVGLQQRLPFLDHRLVEFMWRVPNRYKIHQGITKQLLRRATRGLLPEETRQRVKKTGWNAPAHQWFTGAGREQLLDLVHSQAFRQRGIYNVAEVERLIAEHVEIVERNLPRPNHMMFLWQLVNLELWLAETQKRQYTFLSHAQETTNVA